MRSQLLANMLSNLVYFVLNIGVGLWMVPYFIKTVGVEGYGLIPLVISLTGYMGLVTLSLNSATARYMTVDLEKNNHDIANKTFNTTFFCITLVVLIMLPVVMVFSYFVPALFEIPLHMRQDARLLFAGVLVAFLLNAWSSSFTVSTFARNRLDLRYLIDSAHLILRVALFVVLFSLFAPNLGYVGVAYVAGALCAAYGYYIVWKRLTPELTVDRHLIDRSRLSDLTSMSGWLILNQIGTLLFLNIDLIVVNKLFGSTGGGEYAAVLQWSILLRSMAGILGNAIAPMIMIHYANEKKEQIITLSSRAMKFMGISMALPIGLICGFASPMLLLWLGPQFVNLAPLLLLQVGHLIINLSVIPLFSINTAFNKLQVPGMVMILMGLGNLALALLLPTFFGWGMYGVAAAGAIMLTAKNAIFTPVYCARILDVPLSTFFHSFVPGVVGSVALALGAFTLSCYVSITSWTALFIYGGLFTMLYLISIWFIGINDEEKRAILSLLTFQCQKVRMQETMEGRTSPNIDERETKKEQR